MAATSSSHRFQKVRDDHLTERAEDYVEAIADLAAAGGSDGCRVGALAAHLEVSHVTVVQALGRLARRGLVHRVPRGPVTLTAAGRRMARESRERHDVLLAFLKWLGVPDRVAERDAEGLEHHASSVTLERLRALMADQSPPPAREPRRPSDAIRLATTQRPTKAPRA